MTRKTIILLIAVLILSIALVSCAPGPDSRYNPDNKAGLFSGFWHGLIALITLVLSIFTDLKMYEINNTGFWYDLGFFLGFLIISGGLTRSRKKKH